MSRADWSMTSTSGGYLGRYNLGLSYTPQGRHHFGFSWAYTPDQLMGPIRQLNLSYVYSPWRIERDEWVLRPLEAGVVLTSTSRKEYFISSPGKYDDDNYYDVTKIRGGLTLGFSVGRKLDEGRVLSVGWFMTILEQGLLSASNNGWSQALENFISSGFGLKLDF
ncbi:MAG: hypothetical protein KF802_07210 [Bdellovibrionaceae bacterium]|nr:hypothetical protein [Pseudobdellovibrionaceae bacterium]MBX3033041.1 hypothetical protein [Pseudobdellovibrionaceae bacterium]